MASQNEMVGSLDAIGSDGAERLIPADLTAFRVLAMRSAAAHDVRGFSIALIESDKDPVYIEWGQDNVGLPFGRSTRVGLGCAAHALLGSLICSLVTDGILDSDATLDQLLGKNSRQEAELLRRITIDDLLGHVHGLDTTRGWTENDEILPLHQRRPFRELVPARSFAVYSPLGYRILAEMLDGSLGATFVERYITTRLLDSLFDGQVDSVTRDHDTVRKLATGTGVKMSAAELARFVRTFVKSSRTDGRGQTYASMCEPVGTVPVAGAGFLGTGRGWLRYRSSLWGLSGTTTDSQVMMRFSLKPPQAVVLAARMRPSRSFFFSLFPSTAPLRVERAHDLRKRDGDVHGHYVNSRGWVDLERDGSDLSGTACIDSRTTTLRLRHVAGQCYLVGTKHPAMPLPYCWLLGGTEGGSGQFLWTEDAVWKRERDE